MFDYKKWKSDGGKSIHDSIRDKQPFKRLENSLNRCINIVIPLHVEMLHKHKANIAKFRQLGEWQNVIREQVNATRTVEQLKSDVWSLDLLRNQLIDNDLPEFEKRTKHIHKMVIDAIQTFIDESDVTVEYQSGKAFIFQSSYQEPSDEIDNSCQHQENLLVQINDKQTLQERLEESRQAEMSWKQLMNDLEDIKEMMSVFASCVHQHQEAINTIESNIEKADDNVSRGKRYLKQAVKYKAAVYPLTGALLGSCIFGPIGLIVGLKAGVAAVAIGGLLGFQSGRILKKSKMKALELEWHNVSQSDCNEKPITRSASFPNLTLPNSKCHSM